MLGFAILSVSVDVIKQYSREPVFTHSFESPSLRCERTRGCLSCRQAELYSEWWIAFSAGSLNLNNSFNRVLRSESRLVSPLVIKLKGAFEVYTPQNFSFLT